MNREGDHIENQRHLTESQLIQYSEGVMTDAEMYQVELHLLSCALCSEALEGIELLETGAKKSPMNALHLRFQSRIRNNKPAPKVAYWKWAAVAAILLLSSVALFVLLDSNGIVRDEIVTKESGQFENLRTVEPQPLSALKKDSSIRRDDLSTNNAIALIEKHTETKSSKKELPMAADAETELELSAASAPQEEALESRVLMESKVALRLQDSVNVGEMLAGRTMGLEFSRTARARVSKQLSGKVVDESGNPVPGASIKVKGSNVGGVSDAKGTYTIQIPDSASSLLISSVGYVTEEITLNGGDTSLNSVLIPDAMSLSEVVVIGYGTREKRDVTGSVASVHRKSLPKPKNGRKKFDKYIEENLTTKEAAEAGFEGKLTLSFSVEKDGTLGEFKVIVPAGFGLDEKAIQLIKEGPKWTPATDEEGPVKEKVILAIPVAIKKK